MRRLIGLSAAAAMAIWLMAGAAPAWSQSSGSVTATVVVQGSACITITPTTFSYVASGLSTSTAPVTTLPSSAKPSAANCSTVTQNFLARGGPAMGTGASWTLETAFNCDVPQINMYKHEVKPLSGSFTALTATNQTWESAVPANASRTLDTRLTMPCDGSNGVGQTISIPVTITAVAP